MDQESVTTASSKSVKDYTSGGDTWDDTESDQETADSYESEYDRADEDFSLWDYFKANALTSQLLASPPEETDDNLRIRVSRHEAQEMVYQQLMPRAKKNILKGYNH